MTDPATATVNSVADRSTPGAVLVLTMQRRADISKARDELGYAPGPLEPTVRAWYEFFVRAGMIA